MINWIEFKNVNKFFTEGFWLHKKQVLFDINFSLTRGRCVGFVGPNGAGKTTIIKLLLGFIRPDGGKIFYPSDDNSLMKFKTVLGYLPERPYYYSFLTAHEFLRFHWDLARGVAEAHKSPFSDRANELLSKVKLLHEQKKKLGSFSKGMLQRIGLAAALIHDPLYLVLDEPMSGLDPDGRYDIRQILLEEKKNGKTIFFSSHLIEDVELICDDILIISEGRIIYCGSIQNLKQQMQEEDLYAVLSRMKVGGR